MSAARGQVLLRESGVGPMVVALRTWLRYVLAITYFVGLIFWEIWDAHWSGLLSSVPGVLTVLYLALIVSVYLRRGPGQPLKRAGWLAQGVALLGANLLIPLSMLPAQYPGLETISVLAAGAGLGFSFWAAWHLGAAFSLVPEARRLVTSGPYRWIRHPLYLAGFVIGLGLLLVGASTASLGLFLAFVASQALRIQYEEQVLIDALPEYREYRHRTWALLPHIY